MSDRFTALSDSVSELFGRWQAMVVALSVILLWAVSGPLFGFSDTWQLVINTGTTIVTFLTSFLICAASNRSERRTRTMQEEMRQLLRDELAELGILDTLVRSEAQSDEIVQQMLVELKSLLRQEFSQITTDDQTVSLPDPPKRRSGRRQTGSVQ